MWRDVAAVRALGTDARHADQGGLTAATRRSGHAAWWSVGEIGAGLAVAVAVTHRRGLRSSYWPDSPQPRSSDLN
ncbi:hypothetical protein FHX45_002074 [Amycolatopsis granulosa]|nr:hypothetical protein [Amycolatopsis granulosa]